MQKRKFDELISYFNRKVSDMSIDQKYKMELLGMISAIGFAHEKELSTNLAEVGRDCISRQAAIDTVMECYDNDELFEVYEWKLNELPPIQPRTGKWIYQIGMVKCDQCLRAIRRIDHDGLLNYCPNCGAKMEMEHYG